MVFFWFWGGLKRRMGSCEVLRGASQVTSAAGVVAGAGANITDVAVATAHGTLGASSKVWQRIDLLNLSIRAEQGAIMINDSKQFSSYLNSSAGRLTWNAPEELKAAALTLCCYYLCLNEQILLPLLPRRGWRSLWCALGLTFQSNITRYESKRSGGSEKLEPPIYKRVR